MICRTLGIGRATARALAAAGMKVVVHGRSKVKVDATLAELASEAERLSGEEPLAREAWTAATAEWTALVARSEALDEAVWQR